MTASQDATDLSEQLRKLQSRVTRLARQQEASAAISALGAILIAGATLIVGALAMPWARRGSSPEFSSSTQSGWAAFVADPRAIVYLLVLLGLLGLTVATAVGTSRKLHLTTHIIAGYVCGLPLVALMLAGLREGSTAQPSVGFYTLLIGVIVIAAAALARRRKLDV